MGQKKSQKITESLSEKAPEPRSPLKMLFITMTPGVFNLKYLSFYWVNVKIKLIY